MEQALAREEEILGHTPALQSLFDQGRADLAKVEAIERRFDELRAQPNLTVQAVTELGKFDADEFPSIATFTDVVDQYNRDASKL